MAKTGGKRPGAGRPKGTKNPATLTKEAARLALAQVVYNHMEDLVSAQIANAKGLRYLVTRDKRTGKFIRVTETMARAKDLGENEEIIEVWEKDPNVQAFTDLMNRAIDKAKEQPQEVQISGSISLVNERLLAARKRLAGANGRD